MSKRQRILFLDVKAGNDFYNIQRNTYLNVDSVFIFSNNTKLSKILRRIYLGLDLNIEYLLGEWKNKLDYYDIVVITDSIYNRIVARYVRGNTNARIIMWYWNPVIAAFPPNKIDAPNCELWSFDKNDCKNYNMRYNPTYYFFRQKIQEVQIKQDVYFIGSDKGRLGTLEEIEKHLKKYHITTNFHITKTKKSSDSGYKYKEPIPYVEALENLKQSRVILDLLQYGQTGMSQRVMECLCYKKKLITNDVDIINYEFYNPANIFVIGVDSWDNILEFIYSPYQEVSSSIIDKYDFGTWCKRIVEAAI